MDKTDTTRRVSGTISHIDMDWNKLDAVFEAMSFAGKRPNNSVTVSEYAERYDVDPKTAYKHLEKLVDSGKMNKKSQGAGRPAYYWFSEANGEAPTQEETA